MPLTPLHYPVAYALYTLHKKRTLPGLTVGSMFPDLEIPFVFVLYGTDRLMLHSLLGAVTIGTLLSVTFTVTIYPLFLRWIFGIDKDAIQTKTRLSLPLVVSCLVGNLSHVVVDLLNHPYNPLFWPFAPSVLSPICVALGGVEASSWIVHLILLGLFSTVLLTHRDALWETLLVGA